jgi:hypothetical protein
MTPETQPTTEAGRRLQDIPFIDGDDAPIDLTDDILAIEAQAREQAEARAARLAEALKDWDVAEDNLDASALGSEELWAAAVKRSDDAKAAIRAALADVPSLETPLRRIAEIVSRHTHQGNWAMTRYAGPNPEED